MPGRVLPYVVVLLLIIPSTPASATTDVSSLSTEDGDLSEATTNRDVINITYTYHLTPSEPDSIQVNVNIRFPNSIERFYIRVPNESEITSKTEFTHSASEWDYVARPGGTTSEAEISYKMSANSTLDRRPGALISHDAGNWALINYDEFRVDFQYEYQGTSTPPTFRYIHEIAGMGVAGSAAGYLGKAEVRSQTINNQSVKLVIPNNTSIESNETFSALSFAATNLQVGPRTSPLHIFIGNDPLHDGAAYNFATSHLGGEQYPRDAFVHEDRVGGEDGSTLLQEYVHTRELYQTTENMEWLDEGIANYYEYLLAYHLKDTDYSQFYDRVSTLEYADADLTTPSVWESYIVEYEKGTRVIAGLDVEIRERTDGERSFEQVFRLMNKEEDEITYDRFGEMLATVTGDEMRPWLDRYVKGDEVPAVPKNSSKYTLNPPYLESGQTETVDVVDEGWPFETGDDVYSSPAVVDGTVYIGSRDNNVYALNTTDGTEQWRFDTNGGVVSSPAVVDGTVFVGSHVNKVYALNASDGTEQWRFQTGDVLTSSPAVVDGTVYVGSFDHTVYALDASDGTEQWRFETGGFVASSPVVVDGTVFVGSTDNSIYALNASDGTEQWRFETGDEVTSAPTVMDGTVFVGSYDGNVYALNANDGTEQWRFETDLWVSSSPAVVDGTVYVGSFDDNVYALNASDGTEQWRFQTGDPVSSSPTVVDGTVYVGSEDSNVYALNASDGTEQWRFETGDEVTSSPAVIDGTVYVGSQDNNVYKITDESPKITPTTTKQPTEGTESEPEITPTTTKQPTEGTESEPGTSPSKSQSTSSNAPGFGLISGFVGVLGASYLASRFMWSSDE